MTTVTDGSYRARLLGLLGERNPIESLESSAARVERTVRRLDGNGLERPWAPGKWTGKQIVAHLADAELGVGFRVRQILAEDHHTIQPFDEGKWARRYQDVDVEAALGSFLALRRWNLELFRPLGRAELEREAVHPERGPETLETVIRLLAGHDFNHLAQLEKI
jgi:hypothetical protein